MVPTLAFKTYQYVLSPCFCSVCLECCPSTSLSLSTFAFAALGQISNPVGIGPLLCPHNKHHFQNCNHSLLTGHPPMSPVSVPCTHWSGACMYQAQSVFVILSPLEKRIKCTFTVFQLSCRVLVL